MSDRAVLVFVRMCRTVVVRLLVLTMVDDSARQALPIRRPAPPQALFRAKKAARFTTEVDETTFCKNQVIIGEKLRSLCWCNLSASAYSFFRCFTNVLSTKPKR